MSHEDYELDLIDLNQVNYFIYYYRCLSKVPLYFVKNHRLNVLKMVETLQEEKNKNRKRWQDNISFLHSEFNKPYHNRYWKEDEERQKINDQETQLIESEDNFEKMIVYFIELTDILDKIIDGDKSDFTEEYDHIFKCILTLSNKARSLLSQTYRSGYGKRMFCINEFIDISEIVE
jgi:hypothetical protein